MSTRILIRVATLALGIAALVLVLGTMSSPVQGPSPYASALGDLSVAKASAEPNTCTNLGCKLNKFEIWHCVDRAAVNCTLDIENNECTQTHC